MMNGFERYSKKTRRALFLDEMEQVVPWGKLCSLIEPYYPKAGNGRQPVGMERMLRIYFLQQWFNLSDPAVEEALYDSLVMRAFAFGDRGLGDLQQVGDLAGLGLEVARRAGGNGSGHRSLYIRCR